MNDDKERALPRGRDMSAAEYNRLIRPIGLSWGKMDQDDFVGMHLVDLHDRLNRLSIRMSAFEAEGSVLLEVQRECIALRKELADERERTRQATNKVAELLGKLSEERSNHNVTMLDLNRARAAQRIDEERYNGLVDRVESLLGVVNRLDERLRKAEACTVVIGGPLNRPDVMTEQELSEVARRFQQQRDADEDRIGR